jgi:hypothetical protein
MKKYNTPSTGNTDISAGTYNYDRQTVTFKCCAPKCSMALVLDMVLVSKRGRYTVLQDAIRGADWQSEQPSAVWDGFMTCSKHPVEWEDYMDTADASC